jgi:hypothetical protein
LPEIDANIVPDEKGVESLARQIKVTGRAYPLFDIAQMILQKPERHYVVLGVKKNAEGQPIQPMFVCALDETVWLSQDEAVSHVLRKHFGTFYQTEKTPTEPPKGKYTFVAQCGMSGAVLGPPNYHDYQNRLRKLHAERYSRMPFETYKSRVRIVRDEAIVKQWVEEQSFKTEFTCLNQPEPLRLENMEAVEKHFREVHLANIVKQVDSHTLVGTAAKALRSPELSRLVRSVWEDQRRFPLQVATVLSQQFSVHGLQFFKVNKSITHVSVARPHYLDLAAAPVSESIRKIVEFINAHPRCNRRQLIEALAPTPPPAPKPVGEPAPDTPPVQEAAAPTPEQTAVIADLHWLVHQGHVIEFANGILETAKKPVLKPPPKPESKKPVEKTAEATAATVSVESATSTDAVQAEPTPTDAPQFAVPESPAEPVAPDHVTIEVPPAAEAASQPLPGAASPAQTTPASDETPGTEGSPDPAKVTSQPSPTGG